MRQDFAFVAERALACHSADLLRPGPADADLTAALEQAGARLARILRGALAGLCGNMAPDVTVDPPREIVFGQFAQAGLYAYSTYTIENSGERLLGAIGGDAVLRLVDRAFGGPGEPPRPMPRELPMSADLMVARIETILAAALGQALGSASAGHPTIQPLRRDTDLSQLQTFDRSTRLAVLDIGISETKRPEWLIRMALPMALLPALTGMVAPAPTRRTAAPADPDAEPFAGVPLTLTALLVDTRLPLQVVSRLEPGQVLNLPIARQVPLVIGQNAIRRTVAHGTIGALDDRVAIQINRLA